MDSRTRSLHVDEKGFEDNPGDICHLVELVSACGGLEVMKRVGIVCAVTR